MTHEIKVGYEYRVVDAEKAIVSVYYENGDLFLVDSVDSCGDGFDKELDIFISEEDLEEGWIEFVRDTNSQESTSAPENGPSICKASIRTPHRQIYDHLGAEVYKVWLQRCRELTGTPRGTKVEYNYCEFNTCPVDEDGELKQGYELYDLAFAWEFTPERQSYWEKRESIPE